MVDFMVITWHCRVGNDKVGLEGRRSTVGDRDLNWDRRCVDLQFGREPRQNVGDAFAGRRKNRFFRLG